MKPGNGSYYEAVPTLLGIGKGDRCHEHVSNTGSCCRKLKVSLTFRFQVPGPVESLPTVWLVAKDNAFPKTVTAAVHPTGALSRIGNSSSAFEQIVAHKRQSDHQIPPLATWFFVPAWQ